MQERIISGRERDEDIEDEVEMYAEYVHDPDVQKRRARAQSRAEAWKADQRTAYRVSFQGAQHEIGSGNGSGSGMKSFREAIGGFAEPSVIAGRERVESGPMVAWVARATTERGEYELDEEANDPEDPPRPNTFLARAAAEATAEEEGDSGNVGQPYSPHYEMDLEAEVDLLGDIELEHVERTIGGRVLLLQMLEVAVVVTMEVVTVVREEEMVTVVREEEMVTVVREEEVVGWHSQRSIFSGCNPRY
ncbi:hypothetical protein Taro_034759 [Colocasia esculenta]|uniref:Uncharacterized protein n=1 Tax=Colocasia esculenta TaxID=4460 RepID=A0A843VSD1_COLES|nr:hypothetical protein [Colocasia esculenta]